MKKLPGLALIFLFFSASFCYGSGVVQLPKTGQTDCYDDHGVIISCSGTGQDGDVQEGSKWPTPRFVAGTGSTAECVTDKLTGLMWTKNANLAGLKTTIKDALDYANSLTLCGYSDWRIPNINEIESLIHLGTDDTIVWLTSKGFSNVQDYRPYWSSTHLPRTQQSKTWVIWMENGFMLVFDDNLVNDLLEGYVWPVRGGKSGSGVLPRTGQTKCYNGFTTEILCTGTGQDGDIQAGAPWPATRFIDLGNGAVIDNLTGLMWTKDANAPGPSVCNPGTNRHWQEALDYAKCLNTEKYLGYDNWKVPNRREMRSLIDYSFASGALSPGHPFMNVSNSDHYWTSTTYASNASDAWTVYLYDFDYGVSNSDKLGWSSCAWYPDFCYPVWPVRTVVSSHLAVLKTGTGTVTSVPAGITCGATCSSQFLQGTVVTLTATPATGQVFTGWSGGGCGGTATTCTVTVTGNTTISADFAPQILTVFGIVSGTHGTVSPGTQKVSYGLPATVTFTPNSGYGIATLADTGTFVPIVNPYVISSVTSNHTVVASFASSLPLNLTKAGAGSGTVTSSPAGINCTAACSVSFPANTVVTLTAMPGEQSVFKGWSGACTGTGTCQLTMDSVKDVTATFNKPVLLGPVYTVNASVSGTHGTVNPLTQKILTNQSASISISPDKGYHIASIIDNGQSMPVANPYLINNVIADHTVAVAFSNFYILNTSKSGSGAGNITTSPKGVACGDTCQYYKPGTKVTLIAKPDGKSTFTGWTGACTGTDPCKVTMNSDVTTGATFASESHLTVNPESKSYGEVKINTTKSALFIVKNTGKKDVAISSTLIQGAGPEQFTLHSDRCTNKTLKTNRTCTESVLFAPTAPGALGADMVITSDDTIHPALTVPLSGIGEN